MMDACAWRPLSPPLPLPPLRMEALLNEWLWQDGFLLPPGARWQDLSAQDQLPLPRDLLYTLPLALVFVALRYVFER